MGYNATGQNFGRQLEQKRQQREQEKFFKKEVERARNMAAQPVKD